jgi:hypothetical protein
MKEGVTISRNDMFNVPFEFKLFFSVVILLSWPVTICAVLQSKPSVNYWFGDWAAMISIGVCIWTAFMYFVYIIGLCSRSMAAVLMLILPCTAFTIFCEVQDLRFQTMATALRSLDCTSHKDKFNLQQAWEAAHDVSVKCEANLQKLTGAPVKQIKQVRNFEDCQGYKEAESAHMKEFKYLKGLESKYSCGGWCHPDYPLWDHSDTPEDSCSIAAGRAMTNSIAHMGTQVAVYCFIVLATVSSWMLLAPKWLQDSA